MIFAVVIFGCILGWFRFFRVSNLIFAIASFSKPSRYPSFVGIIYILLFGLCFILLFHADVLANFIDYTERRNFLGLKIFFSIFSYFTASVIFGEICRLLNTPEGEEDENDNFLDLLQSLSPRYYAEGSFERVLGFEACVAIEV